MYSGTTFHNKSGHIVGVHQRVNRVARRKLRQHLGRENHFPLIKDILHFEGKNGPDGIKSKSPSRDDPWHFVNPEDPKDTALYGFIEDHIHNLSEALKDDNQERAAFEAAWLAHSVVDGLTPAHHFPLAEEIERLWGKPKDARFTIREKNIIVGTDRRDTLSRNWKYWGAKGVWTTHYLFEWGVASSIASQRFNDVVVPQEDFDFVRKHGFIKLYKHMVEEVYALNMYETYYKKGWNRVLARESREILLPIVINAVTLAWFAATSKNSKT